MKTSKFWLLDAHCDSFEMRNFLKHDFDLNCGKYLITKAIRDYLKTTFGSVVKSNYYHVTFSRLKKGNVRALLLNVADYDLLRSSEMIGGAYDLVEDKNNNAIICHNKAEILEAVRKNKTAIILAAEGPLVFQGKVDLLHNWHRLGVRMVNLSHGEGTEGFPQNAKLVYKHLVKFAPQCALQISTSTERYLSATAREALYKKEKGLSKLGKQMLAEMAKLNIICDLSHANDAAFWEALETEKGKFCVTHSNCASLCNHSRNLTDKMMSALAQRGGVMGLCFYGRFIDECKPSLDKFIAHVLHALEIMGPSHIGIGSDFDGVEPEAWMAIPHPGQINILWEKLAKAGVNEATITKIAHGNFLKLLGN